VLIEEKGKGREPEVIFLERADADAEKGGKAKNRPERRSGKEKKLSGCAAGEPTTALPSKKQFLDLLERGKKKVTHCRMHRGHAGERPQVLPDREGIDYYRGNDSASLRKGMKRRACMHLRKSAA